MRVTHFIFISFFLFVWQVSYAGNTPDLETLRGQCPAHAALMKAAAQRSKNLDDALDDLLTRADLTVFIESHGEKNAPAFYRKVVEKLKSLPGKSCLLHEFGVKSCLTNCDKASLACRHGKRWKTKTEAPICYDDGQSQAVYAAWHAGVTSRHADTKDCPGVVGDIKKINCRDKTMAQSSKNAFTLHGCNRAVLIVGGNHALDKRPGRQNIIQRLKKDEDFSGKKLQVASLVDPNTSGFRVDARYYLDFYNKNHKLETLCSHVPEPTGLNGGAYIGDLEKDAIPYSVTQSAQVHWKEVDYIFMIGCPDPSQTTCKSTGTLNFDNSPQTYPLVKPSHNENDKAKPRAVQ